MSRTLKYLLTIVLIIAAAMWMMTVYRSCEANKKKVDTTTTNLDSTNSGTDDLEDLYDEEDEEDDEGTGESGLTAQDATGADTGEDESATDEDDEGKGTSEYEEDSNVSVAGDGINKNGGEYLVVAGAFVSKRNAQAFQKQLERRDYDSEIRVFLGSDYHSVILGNYIARSEAAGIARKIGGEAYVHKKRYPKKRR